MSKQPWNSKAKKRRKEWKRSKVGDEKTMIPLKGKSINFLPVLCARFSFECHRIFAAAIVVVVVFFICRLTNKTENKINQYRRNQRRRRRHNVMWGTHIFTEIPTKKTKIYILLREMICSTQWKKKKKEKKGKTTFLFFICHANKTNNTNKNHANRESSGKEGRIQECLLVTYHFKRAYSSFYITGNIFFIAEMLDFHKEWKS